MKRPIRIAVLGSMAFTLLAGTTPVHADECASYSAMQLVYAREIDSRNQYLAFADRAREEGLTAVSCLFRVVARAESVHALNHAVAILQEFDGVPQGGPTKLVVHGTVENLMTSIALEQLEREEIYPLIADCLRRSCKYDALASCNYARGAEATHEQAFRAALDALEEKPVARGSSPWIAGTRQEPESYFLCLGDGSVFMQPVKRCPNCGHGGAFVVESLSHRAEHEPEVAQPEERSLRSVGKPVL